MWTQIFPIIMLIIMLPIGLAMAALPIWVIYKVIKKAVKDGSIEAKGKYHQEEE